MSLAGCESAAEEEVFIGEVAAVLFTIIGASVCGFFNTKRTNAAMTTANAAMPMMTAWGLSLVENWSSRTPAARIASAVRIHARKVRSFASVKR